MKSSKLVGIDRIEIIETDMPQIKNPKDVLIRMARVGICGSDVHYFDKGMIGSQIVKYPFTVGHEGSGIVAEIGSGVTGLKTGDRIAIEPAMPCFECDQCQIGRFNTCRKLKFLGCPGQTEGCLAEYIVMPETSCYLIPDEMNLDEAALSEPLAIGLYAVKQSIPLEGAKIAILGAGPIGLSVLISAIHRGAKEIYITDKIYDRLDIAMSLGATWAGNPLEINVVKEINSREPLQLDAVFECCGEQEAMDTAIEILKPGGKLMLIGIPATAERVSFKIDYLRRKEINIQNVRRQNETGQEALDMISERKINVNFMVTHRFKIDELEEAMNLVKSYKDGVIKAMIDFI